MVSLNILNVASSGTHVALQAKDRNMRPSRTNPFFSLGVVLGVEP